MKLGFLQQEKDAQSKLETRNVGETVLSVGIILTFYYSITLRKYYKDDFNIGLRK